MDFHQRCHQCVEMLSAFQMASEMQLRCKADGKFIQSVNHRCSDLCGFCGRIRWYLGRDSDSYGLGQLAFTRTLASHRSNKLPALAEKLHSPIVPVGHHNGPTLPSSNSDLGTQPHFQSQRYFTFGPRIGKEHAAPFRRQILGGLCRGVRQFHRNQEAST